MLTTHLASWLVSRALKGRTLTATFTEAPAIAPDTPALLSWRTEKEMLIRATERTPTSLPSFSLQPSFYSPSPTNQSLKDPVPAPSGLPPKYHYFGGSKHILASVPSHLPVWRDLGHHPRVTLCPGPRSEVLYQFWLPPTLVGGAPSYTWGLATPARTVRETLVVGEDWLGGTCGFRVCLGFCI